MRGHTGACHAWTGHALGGHAWADQGFAVTAAGWGLAKCPAQAAGPDRSFLSGARI